MSSFSISSRISNESRLLFDNPYFTTSPGSVPVLLGTERPGYIVVFAPNRTWSPTILPSFRLPVSVSCHLDMAFIFWLSCRQLVVMTPEAKFTSLPAIVSTITAFCAMTV